MVHPWTGTVSNKPQWKQPRMDLNLLPQGLQLIRSRSYALHSDTWESLCERRVTCLEITALSLSIAPHHTQSSPRGTISYPITESVKLSLQSTSHSTGKMERQTQLISSVNIGNSPQFGPCSDLCYSGEEKSRKVMRELTILIRRIVGSVRILTKN